MPLFSNSPKRQLAFERWIEQKLEGERRSKFKSICRTRWVERHEAFDVFIDLFEPLICCLEDIKDSTDWNRESRSDAQSLLLALTHVDTVHARIYETALEIASKVGVDESMPRISSRQQHRSNVPSLDPSEYYKRILTIPTLDHLITEMDGRFHHDSASIVCQIMLILPSTLAESEDVLTSTMISDLIHMYEDYLPAPGSIDTELHCWGVK